MGLCALNSYKAQSDSLQSLLIQVNIGRNQCQSCPGIPFGRVLGSALNLFMFNIFCTR